MNPGRSHEENQLCELFKSCLLSSFKLFVLHGKGRGKSSPQAAIQSPPTEQRRRGRTVTMDRAIGEEGSSFPLHTPEEEEERERELVMLERGRHMTKPTTAYASA